MLARAMPLPFHTAGHSNRSLDEFVALLVPAAIEIVVDVRAFPRSRTNPQFDIDVLPAALATRGIDYRHDAALGGRRRASPHGASPNGWWTHAGFRNYADYALTDAFRAAFEALHALGRRRRVAIICSEAVWWRCHRRLIADRLLAAGEAVQHLMTPGRSTPAVLTPAARVRADGAIEYPPLGEDAA